MADINASLHITKRKRKSNVQHHSQADDLRARFKVPEWGVFCHTERLRDHPARLKLVLSDSTARRVILTKPSQIILYFQKIDGFFMKIRVTSNLIFFYLFGWRAWKILAEGDKSGTLVCRQG